MPDLIGIASPFLFARRWSPSMLFGASKLGLLLSAARLDALFQDAAGTIRVNAPGQPIGLWRDTRGMIAAVQAVALNRPVLGRHPASGLRQLLANSTSCSSSAWNTLGLTLTAVQVSGDIYGVTAPAEAQRYGIYDVTNAAWIVYATAWPTSSGRFSAQFTTPANCTSIRVYPARSNDANVYAYQTVPVAPAAIYNMSLHVNGGVFGGCQVEAGAAPTPYQAAASAHDVTEPGYGDLWYVGTNGVNQFMKVPNLVWGGSDKVTLTAVIAAYKTGVQSGVIRGGGNASPTRFGMVKQSNDRMNVNSAGSVIASTTHSTEVSGSAEIYTMQADIGAPSIQLRRNGILSGGTTATQGAGAYADYDFEIASWGGGQFCAARYYCIHAINDWLSDKDRDRTIAFMADLGGMALA